MYFMQLCQYQLSNYKTKHKKKNKSYNIGRKIGFY
jgi:hypothetical protein